MFCDHLARNDFGSAAIDLLFLCAMFWAFPSYIINVYAFMQAQAYIDCGDYTKAERLSLATIRFLDLLPGTHTAALVSCYSMLGLAHAMQGKREQEEGSYRKSLQLLETLKKYSSDPIAAMCLNNLAWSLVRNGDLEEGNALTQRALAICSNYKHGTDPLTAFPLFTSALAEVRVGAWTSAEKQLRQAVGLLEQGKFSSFLTTRGSAYNLLSCKMTLAFVFYKLDKISEGKELSQLIADQLAENELLSTSWHIRSVVELCQTLIEHNEFSIAETLLDHFYHQAQKQPDYPDNSSLLGCYEDLLRRTDRESEIADLRRWIRPTSAHLLT